jgi:putative ABC transport system permease protein
VNSVWSVLAQTGNPENPNEVNISQPCCALSARADAGLRRALGATRGHIRTQFLSEAVLLALIGGAAGVAAGALATVIYASTKHWAVVIRPEARAGGIAAAIAIRTIAGLLPALRAARLSPTEALRTV